MVAAPFLALLYDVSFGLGVLTVGLAVTAFLAIDSAREAAPDLARRLHLLAIINGGLAILGACLLAWRILG